MAKKILLVDDEKIVVKSITVLLKRQGYDVVGASGGKEALMKLKNNDFSLIISDLRMPDKNGIEMIKEARSYLRAEGKENIPEILITGYADISHYKEAVKLGVKGYLYKPFDNKDLIQAVKKAIG